MINFNEAMQKILDGENVVNIGQLSKETIRLLDKAANKGAISKGKGGCFPALKTVYAHVGYDFIEERNKEVKHMLYLAELDKKCQLKQKAST